MIPVCWTKNLKAMTEIGIIAAIIYHFWALHRARKRWESENRNEWLRAEAYGKLVARQSEIIRDNHEVIKQQREVINKPKIYEN